MDFFEQQEQARRQTRRLVYLFILAVIGIVVAVNVAMALIWPFLGPMATGDAVSAPAAPHFLLASAITLLLISGGTLFKIWSLRDGGDAVAKMAGGRQILPMTTDFHERRLLNIVEEMALASGVTMPKVYVMDHEVSINAFAAGFSPNEAVVAVTRGTMMRLSRDELQGVVAHEFSHILNGDMRLNLRLIGVVHGILLIALIGERLLRSMRYTRSSSRDNKGGGIIVAVLAMGVALWVIGYIGVVFGRLIKSAVSRQREFLADASAVQFTRNPDGIGGALRKIGGIAQPGHPGSEILDADAETLSHMFLGAARKSLMSGLFATHPPLEERVRRIYGRSMPMLSAPGIEGAENDTAPGMAAPDAAAAFAGVTAATVAASVAASTTASAAAPATTSTPAAPLATPVGAWPAALHEAVHDPFGAQGLVFALLWSDRADERAQQKEVARAYTSALAFEHAERLMELLPHLPRGARLAALDLAMPALKLPVIAERRKFLTAVERTILADGRVTLAEFIIQTILTHRLDQHAGRAVPIRHNQLAAVRDPLAVALSLVAHVRAAGTAEAAATAAAVFERGASELGLTLHMQPATQLTFATVRAALEELNMLAPLKKPLVTKAIAAALQAPGGALPDQSAELLHAFGAAIDVPVPALG